MEEQEISKTLLKKEMLALHKLGKKVVSLPDSQLKLMPLDEKLLDAVLAARKITKHGGLKRQLQYIGKLMRHVDPEPIREALLKIEEGQQQDSLLFHLKEQWRDKLLTGESKILTEFFNQYPDTDLQRLRQLLRNYKGAKTEAKKTQAARLVFKLISQEIK
ncbi:MAG: ribosome-associated protein [Gammaproteobacteria bacterium]|nr:MAG: ribosome-associated protein [Gammaproteobacteria bacterium]